MLKSVVDILYRLVRLIFSFGKLGSLEVDEGRIEVVGLENGTIGRLGMPSLSSNLGCLEPQFTNLSSARRRVAESAEVSYEYSHRVRWRANLLKTEDCTLHVEDRFTSSESRGS